MESQAKSKYREEHNAPLPGAAADLARSCDEQLLDVFLAIKRISDERALLVERRGREREREESARQRYLTRHWSAAVDCTDLQARQWYTPRNDEVQTYGDSVRRHQ